MNARIWVLGFTVVVALAGCNENEGAAKWLSNLFNSMNPDQQLLSNFKSSNEGQTLAKCVGVDGDIKWSIGSSEKKNKNIRIIDADMTKKNKSLTVQYLYNIDTNVYEIGFIGQRGKAQSKLAGSLDLSIFCM